MKRNTKPGRSSQNPVFNSKYSQEHRTPESHYHRARPAATRSTDVGVRDLSTSQNDNVAYNDDGLLEWV